MEDGRASPPLQRPGRACVGRLVDMPAAIAGALCCPSVCVGGLGVHPRAHVAWVGEARGGARAVVFAALATCVLRIRGRHRAQKG